jgi:methionyl-tRNA formyltransferase
MNAKRVLFIGSKQLGLRVLQEMYLLAPDKIIGVLTVDDKDDTRTKYKEIVQFANKHKLELYVATNRTHSEEIIAKLQPDISFVVGWYWLMHRSTLERVPGGFIGIHNSVLPKYRGGSPLIWPIIKGENEVGFSIFTFTDGLDEGPIWAQGKVSVGDNDYISDVLEKLETLTIDVMRQSYLGIINGTLGPVDQAHELATYCSQRFPADGNIDWKRSAQEVFNFIRAQSDPYPGAFTYFEHQQMIIWKARVFEFPYYGTPGQVARILNDEVYVICGDDRAIVLQEVEVNGVRAKATKFIKSFKIRLSQVPTEKCL